MCGRTLLSTLTQISTIHEHIKKLHRYLLNHCGKKICHQNKQNPVANIMYKKKHKKPKIIFSFSEPKTIRFDAIWASG